MDGEKKQLIEDLNILRNNVIELLEGVSFILLDINYLSKDIKETIEEDKKYP